MPAEDARAVLLITTVDIGGGQSEKIELRQGESPLDVARAFCQAHGISASVVAPLAEHITQNLHKPQVGRGLRLHPGPEEEGRKDARSSERVTSPLVDMCTQAEGVASLASPPPPQAADAARSHGSSSTGGTSSQRDGALPDGANG